VNSGDIPINHQPGEATPQEVRSPALTVSDFGLHDALWEGDQWKQLLQNLIDSGMATWKDVTALVLGHLNPSQVGTSLASSKGFKKKYGKGKTMRVVRDWMYKQSGICADCNTRLELQADHIKGREAFSDPLDADFIENMTLRCRRCNVVRRPSHEFGGLTHLTAEAALMWILLVIRPRTFRDYARMCRLYGMTMSDIRMQEAWAMAHWLARSDPPSYGIEDDEHGHYDLLLWQDGAVTRVDPGDAIPTDAGRLYKNITGTSIFGFVVQLDDGRLKFYEQPISFIPFSTYDLGSRPQGSLALHYAPPDRTAKKRTGLKWLAPRGLKLAWHAVREPEQCFQLVSTGGLFPYSLVLPEAPTLGKLLKTAVPINQGDLQVIARPT